MVANQFCHHLDAKKTDGQTGVTDGQTAVYLLSIGSVQ